MQEDKKVNLPKNFLWGASVSAHQTEGGNHNQWTVWELGHAAELAKKAERHYHYLPREVWKRIKHQASDPNNYISGRGVDHYNRYEEDFDILKSLNLNSFRFGIEWSRIEPDEGVWNQAEIDHYKKYIEEMKKRGIKPVLNLWHWTVPVWFETKGGFEKRRNLKYFLRFVDKISHDLISPCHTLITINEPNSYAAASFTEGRWPPGKHNPILTSRVMYNLMLAHKRTYKLIKTRHPHVQIGLASQIRNIQPRRPANIIDRAVSRWAAYVWNWWFYDRTKKYQDFIGFNYYFTDYLKGFIESNPKRIMAKHIKGGDISFSKLANPDSPVNDMGWYMEPEGLYHVAMAAHRRYKKPIIITENGVADALDQYRKWWIGECLDAMEKANSSGAQVVGYFHWSLLDNFEWADGWWPKFGLVEVDRQNGMKRKVRESAKWLAKIIETRTYD